jgi:hypothetical protein
MLSLSFALFYLPTQIALATLCYRLTGQESVTANRRYYYPGIAYILISVLAAADFIVGLATDFQHLRYSPVSDAFTTNMVDLVTATLFVNMVYQLWTASPHDLKLKDDIVAPMLMASILGTAVQGHDGSCFRPLLIGAVPSMVSAFQKSAHRSPHWDLWFRVVLPIYSLRFMRTTDWCWGWILGWIVYNAGQFMVRVC